MAHRVGINLYPVGFPGHFLLGCDLTQFAAAPTTTAKVTLLTNEDNEDGNDDREDEDDDDGRIGYDKTVFVDSFAGRFLSRNQCKALMRRYGSTVPFNNRV